MLNADDCTVCQVERESDEWWWSFSPSCGVTLYFTYASMQALHKDVCISQNDTDIDTNGIVLINVFFVVSKNLMRKELAEAIDCFFPCVSVFKCPLRLSSLRQCTFYWWLTGVQPPLLLAAAPDNVPESHIIYLTSSHYSTIHTLTEYYVNLKIEVCVCVCSLLALCAVCGCWDMCE